MTLTTLKEAIWGWVDYVINPIVPVPVGDPQPAGVPIIWGWGKGPRPKEKYLSLNITSHPQLGQVYKSDVVITEVDGEDVGTQTFIYQREAFVSIQGYGAAAGDLLEALRISPDFLATSEKLDTLNICVRRIGEVKDISEAVDEQNEQRWLLEVVIGYAQVITDEPGWMEDIEYSGEYKPPQ